MKGDIRRVIVISIILLGDVTAAQATGTFTKLNAGDSHPSWAVPRINNLGHVAMTRATTSAYSGPAYLWTGSWPTLQAFTGSSVGNYTFRPKLDLNDQDRIAYTTGGDGVRVADLSGVITLGAAPTSLNYVIDINNNNRIAAYSWAATSQNRIYSSDPPYTAYSLDVGPTDIIVYHVASNDSGQIAWRPSGTTKNIYRFTPGVGSEVIGSSDYSPFDIDNHGQIIHVRTRNSIMLNNVRLRQSAAVWRSADQYAQPRVSDNGKHVVWTEFDGTRWNLWTLVDGIPTDLTAGGYNDVLSPDVNNDGTIVFASATGIGMSPFLSDVYLYVADGPGPVVYNGHFEGETWFRWETSASGSGHADLVAGTAGGFAAQLTAGSPVSMEQEVDLRVLSGTLSFDFDYLAADGILTVSLGGVGLADLDSLDDTETGFTHFELPIPTPPIGQVDALLSFAFDGPAGAAIQLDNIAIAAVPSAVASSPASPRVLIGPAYPNPFRVGTSVAYDLTQAGRLMVALFSTDGRSLGILADEWRPAGCGKFHWGGTGIAGEAVAPGVYFLRIDAGGRSQTVKAVLTR